VSLPHSIEAPSAQPSRSASSKRPLPWPIAVAFFMESLDTTILNTAVPTIAAALHVYLPAVIWRLEYSETERSFYGNTIAWQRA
jgi:MFS family permease